MKTGINDLLGRGRLMSGKETKSLRKRRRMEFPDTYMPFGGNFNNCAAGRSV